MEEQGLPWMDGACILKSFTEQGCLIPTLGAGGTDSPWEQVWGGWLWKEAKGPQWDLKETPERCLVPWEMQSRELSLHRARQQREGDLCWGQPLPPLGCGKALEPLGETGCRELQDVLLGASGFQTAPRQGHSWAGRDSLALLPWPGVHISRYLIAETPEGGKGRNTLPRRLRESRES